VLRNALESAFPTDPPAPATARSRSDTTIALGLLTVSAVVLVLRAPVAFTKIFADDGSEFIGSAAREISIGSFFTEYRGYLSVIPRAVAVLVVQFPTAWWAAGLAVAALLATASTAVITYLVARWYVPQRALCAVLAVAVSLVPAIRTESIDNVANLQFVLVFAAFWLFLAPMRSQRSTIVRALCVLLIGLSAPLMFVLLPLAIGRVLRFGRRESPLLVATVGALLVQAGARLFWSSSARGGDVKSLANAAVDYGRNVIEATFGGSHLPGGRIYEASLGGFVALGGVSLGVWWLRRLATMEDGTRQQQLAARLEFLMTASILLSGLCMIVEVQLGGAGSYRYAVTPSLFLCTFLAASLSRLWLALHECTSAPTFTPLRRRIASFVLVGVSALVAVGWAQGFSASVYRRSGPSWSTSVAHARAICRGANHPSHVDVRIAPEVSEHHFWVIDLECGSL
jgi:hypothetical protein